MSTNKQNLFLFVTANEYERAAFEKYFTRTGEDYVLGARYYWGEFGNYSCAYIHMHVQGVTNPAATPLVGELLRQLRPIAVVMVGIAFGVDDKIQKVGDVLISDKILPYDSQKIRETETEYKESPKEVGFQLLNAFRDCREWTYNLPDNDSSQSRVIIGSILTGSRLIDNYKYRKKLIEDFARYKPIGGEMEAQGIYSTARLYGVREWIIVKGICDWAYEKNHSNKDKNQETAADAALSYCHHVFSRKQVFNDLVNMKEVSIEKENNSIEFENSCTNKNFHFVFDINTDGVATDLPTPTNNAMREWYYDYAWADVSKISDEKLRDTFTVSINDGRIAQVQASLERINIKIKKNEELSAEDEANYSNCKKLLNRYEYENKLKAAAIKFYVSDRIGYGIFQTFEYHQLRDIIFAILNFSYYDSYSLIKNRDYLQLDVYLDTRGNSKENICFLAHIKKRDVMSCFGGINIYDLYGRSVCELESHMQTIVPYYYFYLAKLKIEKQFDFSQNIQILNFYNFIIGLH